jgi:lipid-binding SYLF domain-containing protein
MLSRASWPTLLAIRLKERQEKRNLMSKTAFGKMLERCTKGILPCLLTLAVLSLSILPAWGDQAKDEETFREAANVLQAMLDSKSIPPGLISKSLCVIVLPNVKKFGIGIGGSGGRGPVSCRTGDNFSGKWSAPAMYSVGGVSAGLQIGGSSTDFVLLVMDQKGVDAIMKGSTKLGRDATAAAGPGATENATGAGNDILTYGRAKGLFAGVSLGGANLDPDNDANKRLYGKDVAALNVLGGNAVKTTAAGQPLISLLNSRAGKYRK